GAARADQSAHRRRRRRDDYRDTPSRQRRLGTLRCPGALPAAGRRPRHDPLRALLGAPAAPREVRSLRDAATEAALERDARTAKTVARTRMLRLLSIRNFVVVESLDLELDGGFSVLTGETGAGKSILLDTLALLLGDRFELRQLRPGAERAELAAEFDIDGRAPVATWLAEQGFAGEGSNLLLRRTQDAQGRSRAWVNGRPATLAQLKEVGEMLVD